MTIQARIANTEVMAGLVAQGALSVALIEGPLVDERFDMRPFREDRLVLAVAPNHPLAAAQRVHVQDLEGQPFIWREAGSGTRAAVERLFGERGVMVRPVLELPSGEGAVRAVKAGMGISILSELIVEDAVAQGKIRSIEFADAELVRTFRIIFLRSRSLSPAVRAFVALLTRSQSQVGTDSETLPPGPRDVG